MRPRIVLRALILLLSAIVRSCSSDSTGEKESIVSSDGVRRRGSLQQYNLTNACDICTCWIRIDEGFVDCRGRKLEDVPFYLPAKVRGEDGAFWPTTNVWLRSTNIQTVKAQIFRESRDITNLLLNNNPLLTFIEHDALANLPKLKNLIIHHTQLKELPASLAPDSRALERLWLHNGNITALEPTTFLGMSNLRELFLNGNQIQLLDHLIFVHLDKLEKLDLTDNPLEITDCDTLNGLPPTCKVRANFVSGEQDVLYCDTNGVTVFSDEEGDESLLTSD